MIENSVILSILNCKCPHCRKGNIFKAPAYSTKFTETHTNCSHCKIHYEPEPGFFWGAMFVSYMFSVAMFIVLGFSTYYIFNNPPILTYGVVIVIGTFVSIPLNFRYARVVFLYLFSGIRYQKGL
jgi:uncharacterized protein (DUF983 family)